MLIPDLHNLIPDYCGLDRARVVLAGVSGGPDSLTLLDVLIGAGFRVEAAYFHHHLRAEADAEAAAVRAAADRYRINCRVGETDVRKLAGEEKLTIEEAARKARYHFLFQAARQCGAQAVAVGHTADDQVETILMHLLRGAGLAGLRGMPRRGFLPEFDPAMPLVRPLLAMWREQILAYCEDHNLKPMIDASNSDPAYYRNRLRLELVPYLARFNPGVKEHLWRMGLTLQGDFDIVEQAVRQAARAVAVESRAGYEEFDRERFLGYPAGVQRRLMQGMISRLRADNRDIEFAMVERALGFVRESTRSGEMELALGLSLVRIGESVILKETDREVVKTTWPRLEVDEILLTVPGRIPLPDGWELTAEAGDWKGAPAADGGMVAWLDGDKTRAALTVRRHRAGDRMRPIGFAGRSIKISDVWVNQKLPRQARKNWPLVCSGEAIAWLPGYRPGIDFIPDELSHRVVKLSLRKRD